MKCLLLAICLTGRAEYTVDTIKYTVEPNCIMIIGEDQVTDNYLLSSDCRGIAIMLSYDFFNEIIKGVHELSSLFLFSRSHPVCSLMPEEANTIVNYGRMIKKKVDEHDHHFRRETVQSMMTTMVYDVSNAIYRIQDVADKKMTRAGIGVHFFHQTRGTKLPQRAPCGMVWSADEHLPEISLRDHQTS